MFTYQFDYNVVFQTHSSTQIYFQIVDLLQRAWKLLEYFYKRYVNHGLFQRSL